MEYTRHQSHLTCQLTCCRPLGSRVQSSWSGSQRGPGGSGSGAMVDSDKTLEAIRWSGIDARAGEGALPTLSLLDQRRLPHEEVWIDVPDCEVSVQTGDRLRPSQLAQRRRGGHCCRCCRDGRGRWRPFPEIERPISPLHSCLRTSITFFGCLLSGRAGAPSRAPQCSPFPPLARLLAPSSYSTPYNHSTGRLARHP